MKKFTLIAAVVGLLILSVVTTAFAFAQPQAAPTPEIPYGPGMGHHGGHGWGMMGRAGDHGPMHDAMIAAFAEALDLSVEEIEARYEAGENMYSIAEAEGLTLEELRKIMESVHDTFMDDADANDWFSSDHAEWMEERMKYMWGDSDGYGYGHGYGRGRCGHWSGQSFPAE
jgi:hypothetical protein